MQNQDLSKIDFGKLTLPEWRGEIIRVKQLLSDNLQLERITVDGFVHYAARRDNTGKWFSCVNAAFAELDQLRAICSQVDAFIATELARLAEPDWVEVKWTEVARITTACPSVSVQCMPPVYDTWSPLSNGKTINGIREYRYQVDTKTVPAGVNLYEPDWVEAKWTEVERLQRSGASVQGKTTGVPGGFCKRLACAYDCIDRTGTTVYQVDTKTLPDGVALYEPEWVEIPWSKATELAMAGADVIDDHRDALTAANNYSATNLRTYKADRKTFPPGFELTKAGPAKPAREVPKCWEAVDFDAFTAKTRTGLGLVLDTSAIAVYLCSKETMRRIMRREYDAVWRTDEGAGYVDEAGMADLFAICKRVDEHIEKALNPEPAWLPCTREEAEGNPGESEATWGDRAAWRECDAHAMRWTLEHSGPEVPLRRRPEYRTRAKVDRWVKVPWGDADRLVKECATVERDMSFTDVPKWEPKCGHWSASKTVKYRADRSTLPAGYVLGVGFVEETKAEAVKVKTLREKVTAASHGDGPNGKWTKRTVDALIDVLEEERAIE